MDVDGGEKGGGGCKSNFLLTQWEVSLPSPSWAQKTMLIICKQQFIALMD